MLRIASRKQPITPANVKSYQIDTSLLLLIKVTSRKSCSCFCSFVATGVTGASTSDFKTVQTQAAAAGCRADVQDLSPGTQYFFQVYAVNSQGASPASSIGQTSHASSSLLVTSLFSFINLAFAEGFWFCNSFLMK